VLKKILTASLFLVLCFDLGACAYMSANGRQQMAYQRYIRKNLRQRQRQQARAQKAANRQLKQKMKLAVPSEPQLTTGVETVPASMSEPVVNPITVSASAPIANGNEPPAQP
jgi:Na+-translocating ferredoxin:NAD+ oxidoreductase RnfC subunit